VVELKAKISEKTNVPAEMQRIIFKGKVLHDDKDLSFYAVQDGHALHMVERPTQQSNIP
jgi:ubiquilin